MTWLLWATSAWAAAPADGEVFELRNGLTVVLWPMPDARSVVSNLTFDVGSGQDPEDRPGLAHLFEHLAFQGTVSSPELLFDLVLREGGGVNGSTASDYTDYYVELPPEKLPLALFLTSETLGWLVPALRQDTLDDELGVVHNELRQRYETPPSGPLFLRLGEAMFPEGHPYHRPGIGTHASLDLVTLDDVRSFFETWYTPGHATLVVTGAFDPSVARKEVRRYFGDVPAGRTTAVDVPEAPLAADGRVDLVREGLNPMVMVVRRAPDGAEDLERLALLVTGPLSGAPGQRLHQDLVATGLSDQVGAWVWTRRAGTLLVAQAVVSEGRTVDEVADALERALQDLTEGAPITAEELAAAAASLDTAQLIGEQDPTVLARALQSRRLYAGDAFWDPTVVRGSTTPAQVDALWQQILDGHRITVTLRSPEAVEGQP